MDVYKEDVRIQLWAERLEAKPNALVVLQNLVGAQECFAMSGLTRVTKKSICYICNDKESAAYVYSTVRNLQGASRTNRAFR